MHVNFRIFSKINEIDKFRKKNQKYPDQFQRAGQGQGQGQHLENCDISETFWDKLTFLVVECRD